MRAAICVSSSDYDVKHQHNHSTEDDTRLQYIFFLFRNPLDQHITDFTAMVQQ